jgi:hypothetical protein
MPYIEDALPCIGSTGRMAGIHDRAMREELGFEDFINQGLFVME